MQSVFLYSPTTITHYFFSTVENKNLLTLWRPAAFR